MNPNGCLPIAIFSVPNPQTNFNLLSNGLLIYFSCRHDSCQGTSAWLQQRTTTEPWEITLDPFPYVIPTPLHRESHDFWEVSVLDQVFFLHGEKLTGSDSYEGYLFKADFFYLLNISDFWFSGVLSCLGFPRSAGLLHASFKCTGSCCSLPVEVARSCTMLRHQPVQSTSLSSDGFFVCEQRALTEHSFHGSECISFNKLLHWQTGLHLAQQGTKGKTSEIIFLWEKAEDRLRGLLFVLLLCF